MMEDQELNLALRKYNGSVLKNCKRNTKTNGRCLSSNPALRKQKGFVIKKLKKNKIKKLMEDLKTET